jgi:hypothetical protein
VIKTKIKAAAARRRESKLRENLIKSFDCFFGSGRRWWWKKEANECDSDSNTHTGINLFVLIFIMAILMDNKKERTSSSALTTAALTKKNLTQINSDSRGALIGPEMSPPNFTFR